MTEERLKEIEYSGCIGESHCQELIAEVRRLQDRVLPFSGDCPQCGIKINFNVGAIKENQTLRTAYDRSEAREIVLRELLREARVWTNYWDTKQCVNLTKRIDAMLGEK